MKRPGTSIFDKILQKFFEEDNNRSYVNELARRAFVLAFTFEKMKDSNQILNEIDAFFNDKSKNIRIDNLSLASRLLLLEAYAIHGFWDKIDDEKIYAVPEMDVDRTSDDGKASSVQFIHFNFSDDQVNKFKDQNNIIEVGIDHKEYSHTTKFSEDNIKALSADFN